MKKSELKPFGTGSYYWDANNKRWTWEGKLPVNGKLKLKKISGKTTAILFDKLNTQVANIKRSMNPDEHLTLEKWINIWLDVFKKNDIRASTKRIYKGYLNIIIKRFGDTKLNLLKPLELQEYFNELRISGHKKGGGLSASSVNHIRKYLSMVYDDAIKNKFTDYNPVRATKPVHGGKVRKPIVISDEDIVRFINIVKSGSYVNESLQNPKFRKNTIETQYIIKQNYFLILLAFSTGMRISEICGLTWDCVNTEKGYIDVNKQLAKSGEATFNKIFSELKSDNSKRKIYVSKILMRELLDFFEHQKSFAIEMGNFYQNTYNLVFTTSVGTPFNQSNFRRRYFVRMVKAAGIDKNFTFHCIRHTHCSLLLEHNADVKAASMRLGHSDVSFTRRVYQDVLPSMEMSLVETWDNAILNKLDAGKPEEYDDVTK